MAPSLITQRLVAPRLISNPPNPYHRYSTEWLDVPPPANLTVYEEQARSILSRNDSPDIGFEFSVNPYRGCFHSCAYCYARPTHQYLDFGAGTDFERRIVVKINAAKLLAREFAKRSWNRSTVTFSGVTDCYQPLEGSYEITRQCLQVCAEYQNPVTIITKGALIRRDIDLLLTLQKSAAVHVYLSVAFSNDAHARKLEPNAPRPSTRFRVMRELADAGIPVSLGLAPVIPGLNDREIPDILSRAKDAGAQSAFMTLLRLPKEVKTVFIERLKAEFPERQKKVLAHITAARNGALSNADFGARMRGEGALWEAIHWIFESNCKALGLHRPRPAVRGGDETAGKARSEAGTNKHAKDKEAKDRKVKDWSRGTPPQRKTPELPSSPGPLFEFREGK